MLPQETPFSRPRASMDQRSVHSVSAERVSLRSLNRDDSHIDRKTSEVVVPMGIRKIGELNLEKLKEVVEHQHHHHHGNLQQQQQQGNEGEEGEKASEAKLSFYFHKEPAVHLRSLTDLRGSPTLAKIMNRAVFWLDVEAYDHGILQSLSQVRIPNSGCLPGCLLTAC